jgi:hypothetical protein
MDAKRYSEFDRDLESRLIRVEDKLDAINQRIDDALLSRVQSHEERITSLEHWRMWLVGVAAGAGGIMSFIVQNFHR